MSLATIIACAEYFGASPRDLLSRSRKKADVNARNAAFLIMRYRDEVSYPVIGKRFDRDHSTVIYGVRCAFDMISRDGSFAAFIADQIARPKHDIARPAPLRPERQLELLSVKTRAPVKPLAPKVWEKVVIGCGAPMLIDDDGWTPGDIAFRRNLAAGSRKLAAAVNALRAAA